MINPKQLMGVLLDLEGAEDQDRVGRLLETCGAEFRVFGHPGWLRYDAGERTLRDPAAGDAVVPARAQDIDGVRFGDRVIEVRREAEGATPGQVKDPAHDQRLKENNPDAGRAGGEARAAQPQDGGDGRGQVKDPATDMRLKENNPGAGRETNAAARAVSNK